MEKERVRFEVDSVTLLENISRTQLSKVVLWAFASGNNSHDMPVSEETLIKCASTIYDKPLVWEYDPFTNDAGGHSIHEVACGFVPREDNELEYERLEDGRLMFKIKALIWKKYSQNLIKLLEKSKGIKPVSVEITVLNSEKLSDGKVEIKEFCYEAVTILGTNVLPAIDDAKLEVLQFQKIKDKYLETTDSIKDKYLKSMSKCGHLTAVFADNIGVSDNRNQSDGKVEKEDEIVDEKEKMKKSRDEEMASKKDSEKKVDEKMSQEDLSACGENMEKKSDNDAMMEKDPEAKKPTGDDEEKKEEDKADEKTEMSDDSDEDKTADENKEEDKDDSEEEDMAAKMSALESENKDLKTKVEAYEKKEKTLALESIFGEVSDYVPAEEMSNLRERAKSFSLENINVFANEVKAVAFNYTKNSKKEVKNFTKMPLGDNSMGETQIGKYDWKK